MKNYFHFVLILCLTNTYLFAQQKDYYWYKNQKLFLEKIPNKKYVLLNNVSDAEQLKQKLNLSKMKVARFEIANVYSGINAFKGKRQDEQKWAVVEDENIGNKRLTAIVSLNIGIFS